MGRAEASVALRLVKRVVYPIRMMKRPFISELPQATALTRALPLRASVQHTLRETAQGSAGTKCAHTRQEIAMERPGHFLNAFQFASHSVSYKSKWLLLYGRMWGVRMGERKTRLH